MSVWEVGENRLRGPVLEGTGESGPQPERNAGWGGGIAQARPHPPSILSSHPALFLSSLLSSLLPSFFHGLWHKQEPGKYALIEMELKFLDVLPLRTYSGSLLRLL